MLETRERDLDLKTTKVINGKEYLISTVALTIDHGHEKNKPLWYETMIFPSSDGKVTDWGEVYCDRYETKEEAEQGHSSLLNSEFENSEYGLEVIK